MKELLFYLLNFLDFWFFPLIVILAISIVVEQIIRWGANSNPQSSDDSNWINTSMRIRKFIWTQNVILNLTWIICYVLFMYVMRTPNDPLGDPNLLWKI